MTFITASDDGIKTVMSKMGISTLQSKKGAQLVEALGLGSAAIEKCLQGTPSRIPGPTLATLALDALEFHRQAYPRRNNTQNEVLPETSDFHWRGMTSFG